MIVNVLKFLAAAALTAIFTVLAIMGAYRLTGADDRDLAQRVGRNVSAIVCILQIPIEARTDERIRACLIANDLDDVVPLDHG